MGAFELVWKNLTKSLRTRIISSVPVNCKWEWFLGQCFDDRPLGKCSQGSTGILLAFWNRDYCSGKVTTLVVDFGLWPCTSCLFNLCAEYIMRFTGLDEAQAGIKIARRNINNLRYANDTTFMEGNRRTRGSWWKWKRRVKSWLKAQHSENKDHGIRSHHFMANRRRNSGNSDRIYFGGL